MSDGPRKPPSCPDRSQQVARAKQLYCLRRRWMETFDQPDLFGDPALDILLDLYISHHESRKVTISDACAAAAAPWTTALRHLNLLGARGLVRRVADDRDRRRFYIVLESRTLSIIDELLAN